MQITEIRHTPIGTFTIVHEVKERKAWRVPRLKGGKNKAGGAKCYAPKAEPRMPRPPHSIRADDKKFILALQLRSNLIAKINGEPRFHYMVK